MSSSLKEKHLQIGIVVICVLIGTGLYFAKTVPDKVEKDAISAEVPDKDSSSNIDGEIDEALELTESEAPMQGIMKLKEIADENPDNRRVFMELGSMSLQTGQFENAVKRFEHVLNRHEDFLEARYLLAVAQVNTGDTARALENMRTVRDRSGSDREEISEQAEQFIKELTK